MKQQTDGDITPHNDNDVISVKNRIIAEHRKYAPCGSYGTKMATPEDWAEIAAIKILSDVRRGDIQ